MRKELAEALHVLKRKAWRVTCFRRPCPVPPNITERYPWLPQEIAEFISEIREASRHDEKLWFNTCADYAGSSPSAFAWN